MYHRLMHWIYLSPHLDDAVLSCGGIIWKQVQTGNTVEVWTIFAGDPPPGALTPLAEELHARWQTGTGAPASRRQEDITACGLLGASHRHFDLPDCIYRRLPESGAPVILRNEDLFSPIQPGETALVGKIAALLAEIPPTARLVCPLSLGGHVDHRLVRAAAEQLPRTLWFYADFPYSARHPEELDSLLQPHLRARVIPVTAAGLKAWKCAVIAYASQISTFWQDIPAMEEEIERYCRGGGNTLWKSLPRR
jgi:LmbE family N-acetylglucosaminyl deacetylase